MFPLMSDVSYTIEKTACQKEKEQVTSLPRSKTVFFSGSAEVVCRCEISRWEPKSFSIYNSHNNIGCLEQQRWQTDQEFVSNPSQNMQKTMLPNIAGGSKRGSLPKSQMLVSNQTTAAPYHK